MATHIEKSENKLSDTIAQQPAPKIIENAPAASLEQALKNSQAQVDAAKRK